MPTHTSRRSLKKTPPPSTAFNLIMAALSFWMVGGLLLDGWAHNHLDSSLETFFTPWHMVLYSGFTACGLALVVYALHNYRKGFVWNRLLPVGYGAALIGAGIFAAGGGFDIAWHAIFGVERDLESLISPPHLILVTGGILIASGPLRAAWKRTTPPRGMLEWSPVMLSMALSLSLLTFITQFAHFVRDVPVGEKPADETLAAVLQCQNVAGYIVQSALLLGIVLLLFRRWETRLPVGFFTAMLGLNILGMALMTDEYRLVWPALVSGFIIDILIKGLRPSASNIAGLRVFSVAMPTVIMLSFFLTWSLTDHIWWTVHMWGGTIILTAVVGLFLSYLVTPPWPEKT